MFSVESNVFVSVFRECTNKFGEETGNAVWEAVNKVFDCMPLASVLDGKVLNIF